jgi:phage terminase Nu1 subunit (DNA packaging protein)
MQANTAGHVLWMRANAEAAENASLNAEVEELKQERFQLSSWKKKVDGLQKEKEALEILSTQRKDELLTQKDNFSAEAKEMKMRI